MLRDYGGVVISPRYELAVMLVLRYEVRQFLDGLDSSTTDER